MASESQQCDSLENSRDLTSGSSPSADFEHFWQVDGVEMEVRCKDLGGRLVPHSTWPFSTLNLAAARRPIRKPKCKPTSLASRKRIRKLPRPAAKSQAVGKRRKRPRPACKRQPVARKTRKDIAKAPYEPHTCELHGPLSDSELVISCPVPPLHTTVIIRELQRLGRTHDPQYTGYCLMCGRLLSNQEAEQPAEEALQQQEQAALQQQEQAALQQQKQQVDAALQQQRQQRQQEEAALQQQQEEAALQQQEQAALQKQEKEKAALQQQQKDEEAATEKNPDQQVEEEDATKDCQRTEDVLLPEGEPNVFATPSAEQSKLFWYFKKLRN